MPQAAAARELTVSYGGFALANVNGIALDASDEGWRLDLGYARASFSCRLVVRLLAPASPDSAANAVTLAALCAVAETALRRPRQRLVVAFGGASRIDWNPTTLDYFHAEASLEKTGQDDSLRIAHYVFRVAVDLAADLAGQDYRQASDTKLVSTIQGRRTAVLTGRWTSGSTLSASDQYAANGDAFFTGQLPPPVASGEWVLVESDPSYDDENAILTVTRTYWECVNGLREFSVSLARGQNQAVQLTISGTYVTTTAGTARANFAANAPAFLASVKASLTAGVVYEAKPFPAQEGEGTTAETYFFAHTFNEIVYPQSTSPDDPDVVEFSLDVRVSTPFSIGRAVTSTLRPVPLRRAVALYAATVDHTGGADLETLWRTRLRAHAVQAVASRLGGVSIDLVSSEVLSLDLRGNRIVAELEFDVIGSDVLALSIAETVRDTGSENPVPRADGKAHSYYLYRRAARRELARVGIVVYRLGGGFVPQLFGSDEVASGYALAETRLSMTAALARQAAGDYAHLPGWLALGGSVETRPETRWQSDTDVASRTHVEEWLWVESVETAPAGGDA